MLVNILRYLGKMESFLYGSLGTYAKHNELSFYEEYRKKFGETFVIWVGRRPRLYTGNADIARKVKITIILQIINFELPSALC